MNRFVGVFLFAGLFLVTGCRSTLCLESTRKLQRFKGEPAPVYVTNPHLEREFEILRDSQIYVLSADTNTTRKLTLKPIARYGRCANPLMLSAITLGIIPGFMPAAEMFVYDLEVDGATKHFGHHLPVYERLSVWEWLVPRREDKVRAESLQWSRREENGNSRPYWW